MLCFHIPIILIILHLYNDFWHLFLALTWSQGLLCSVRASKCPHGSCLLFGFSFLILVFIAASVSASPCWESVSEIVVYLIPNTIPQRAPMKMWEPSKGKFCSRQWSRMDTSRPQHVTRYSLWSATSSQQLQRSPGPYWLLKMPHLPVSLMRRGKNTALNSDS